MSSPAAGPVRRALFLDFDGVLHPAGGPSGEVLPLFAWVPQLAELLRLHPDVAIVIHSAWREVHSVEEMRELLGPLGSRVIGAAGAGEKGKAILDYLRAHPQLEQWIVVDDCAADFCADLPGPVVACDPLTGICDPATQAALRQWLDESRSDPDAVRSSRSPAPARP